MNGRAAVRKSLIRLISWLGADRRLVGVSALGLAALVAWPMFVAFGPFYGLPVIIPGLLWLGVLWVGRRAYKADPLMIDVVLRQFKYRKYYAPKADLGVAHPTVKDFT